jgi:hydroxyacylglutathione hydrolase
LHYSFLSINLTGTGNSTAKFRQQFIDIMNIKTYINRVPDKWIIKGSFWDNNPNLSYLVTYGSTNLHSVLIDASVTVEELERDLNQLGSKLERILLTHTHIDHSFRLPEIIAKYSDVLIGIHPRGSRNTFPEISYDKYLGLTEGMEIPLGDDRITVLSAPGHTVETICFWDKKNRLFFSGDVIMEGEIGCCDYHSGGNRNVFYQTIIYLLQLLPDSTEIFPGHRINSYSTPPPYLWSNEKKRNIYLQFAAAGNRSKFDQELKGFSLDHEPNNNLLLDCSKIDKITELEKEIWIPDLQSSESTILTRLETGHKMLGWRERERISGLVAWCYSPFDINEPQEKFPHHFSSFSNQPSCNKAEAQSAFIYSVGVTPSKRCKGIGGLLLQWAFEKIKEDGVCQVFVASRLPSYNGSTEFAHETIQQDLEFKKSLDAYLAGGNFPEKIEFARDQAICFCIKNGFLPWLIIPDFINDYPSGNMRVICRMNLEHDQSGID